jgi:putative isomerase
MFRISVTALVAVLVLGAAPQGQGPPGPGGGPARPEDFPNILSMAGRPARVDDWPASRFADLGAWFGYLLPPTGDVPLRGGFVGPFLMDEGAWASLTLAQLRLEDDSGRDLGASGAENFETIVYPGRLHQRFHCEDFAVALDLVFVSGRSAIVRATVTNTGKQPRRVGIGWAGEGIDGGGLFSATPSDVRLETPRHGRVVVVPMTPGAARPFVSPGGQAFQIRPAGVLVLAPGESTLNYLGHVVSAAGEDETAARASLDELARAPARAFMACDRRWSGYLGPVLRIDPALGEGPGYRIAAVKALMTLLGNWRRALGDLRHDGLVSSSALRDFNGFRAADSWKHAAALARFFPELAMAQVRATFDDQDPEGMVAGCTYPDAKANNWTNSGPPLAGWAVWEVYRQTRDRSFIHEMQPLLQRYHDWWGRRRDRDQDGLCEYGAAADRIEAAKRESGTDRAVRFDKASLRKLDDRAWTLDLESVDLNACLYAEKLYLAEISKELLREDPALGLAGGRLQAAIRARMFDRKTGYFYDTLADGRGPLPAQGPEGWIPLWASVATREQAAAVRQALLDPRKFATYLPFPTVAADHPAFDSSAGGRGAVSPDQAYFAVQGLRRYGFTEDARRLTRQLLDRTKGLTQPGLPIRESYDPLSGEGLGAADFSPSAAHLLLLLWGQ